MFNNPFYNSSYYDPSDYYYDPYRQRALAQQRALEQQRLQQEAREQQLHYERLQRAKYLPDEVDDDDFDGDTDWAYRNTLERQHAFERRRQEENILNERRAKQEKLDQLAREEEERRSESLRQAHRQLQAEHRAPLQPPLQPSPPHNHFHVPISSPLEERPPRSRSHSPLAPPEPVQPRHTAEEQNKAATKLQNAFRVHRALSFLKTLETQFDTLLSSFTLPSVIDFQAPGSESPISVTVPVILPTGPSASGDTQTPKLAYDSTNYALHSYMESLNRLLIELDGVESWGDASVRQSRRRTVGKVEAEANRVEIYCKSVWAAHVATASTTNTDNTE